MRIVKIILSIAFLLTLMACSEDFKQGAVEAAQGKSQDTFAEPVTPAAMPFITEETPPAVYNAVVQKLVAATPRVNIAPQPGQLYLAEVAEPITGQGGYGYDPTREGAIEGAREYCEMLSYRKRQVRKGLQFHCVPQVIPFGYYYSRANCVVQVDGMRINWTFFGYTPAAAVPGEKGEIKTIDRTIQALNSLNPPLPERQAYEMAVRAAAEFAYPVVTDSCNRVK